MKIGLIFPNKDRRYKTIHLGLAYLAAYAREQHHDLEFHVLDTRVATSAETRRFFGITYDLIGITVYSPVYFEVISIFNRIRKVDGNVPVCLGGPYVTTIKEEIFRQTPAEYAVIGEGEITFSELIDCIKGRRRPEEIDGLMFKDENGNIVTNPARGKIRDLNSLPVPAYDLFPMHRYPLHRLVTSRGCPYACVWCNSSSIWDQTIRMMTAERMLSEVGFLIKNYGKKIFVFGDNSFNIDLERVEAFCDLLLQNKLDILWSVSLRADRMNQELANKMRRAGCYNVAIGVESANNEILQKIGKGTTIGHISAGIKMLKNAGIEIMSQYVIGNPGETLETIRESIEYAKTSGCDYINFYTILPFKGTAQWDYVKEHGTFFCNEIHDFHTINPRIVFETPEFPYADRLEAIKLVTKEGYYSNQDKKNWMFDLAKEVSRIIQGLLPKSLGDRLYLILKSIYRLKVVKKNNR
mgnify:CR=1 FL=1